MTYGDLPGWAQTSIWVVAGFLLVILVIPPVRSLLGVILKDFGLLKLLALPFVVVMHEVVTAHRVIIMNLRPRIAVLPSIVERKQTNPTHQD